ncbi:hypothetical protein WQ57_05725 [Mesobacillus campisalis]|uniref:Uncharacterized protein n=1 Tax=Mesobacillus campisalis TaxID=1408103 RepID=A0A0M2T0U7_9BACI|nr:Mbeg1-like protein [Mesobacillus campisalis]KKK38852.1 hypothetical protein WQ57_05725 [Mesobacillus campisalis]
MSLDQLTDEEKHVLLTLSYVDLPNNQRLEGKSLEQIWQTAKYNFDEKDDTYHTLNDFITSRNFENSNLKGVTLVGYENFNPNEMNNSQGKSDSGFVGYAFKDSEDNSVAMFRGSESMGNFGHLKTDWSSNLEAGVGIPIQQQNEANAFYRNYMGDLDGERLVLGHSKGGNLASHVFVENLDDNVKSYVINAAPLYWWDLSDRQKEALKGDRNEFIVFKLDPVSQLGYVPYVDRTVGTKPRDSIFQVFNPFYTHGLAAVGGFDHNGNFSRSEKGANWSRDGINYLTAGLVFGASMTNPVLLKKASIYVQNVTPYIMAAAAKGLARTANYLRDESIKLVARLQQMNQALKSRLNSFFDDVAKKAAGLVAGLAGLMSAGSASAAYVEPVISVDIGRLKYYADRLQNLKRRTSHLNEMIDSLYWEAGILGLTHVLRADLSTSFDHRITQSISYLNNTANLLQRNERYLAQQAHSVRT